MDRRTKDLCEIPSSSSAVYIEEGSDSQLKIASHELSEEDLFILYDELAEWQRNFAANNPNDERLKGRFIPHAKYWPRANELTEDQLTSVMIAGCRKSAVELSRRREQISVSAFWKSFAEMKVNQLQVDNSLVQKIGEEKARLKANGDPAEKFIRMTISYGIKDVPLGSYIADKNHDHQCTLSVDLRPSPINPPSIDYYGKEIKVKLPNGLSFRSSAIIAIQYQGKNHQIQTVFCYQLGTLKYRITGDRGLHDTVYAVLGSLNPDGSVNSFMLAARYWVTSTGPSGHKHMRFYENKLRLPGTDTFTLAELKWRRPSEISDFARKNPSTKDRLYIKPLLVDRQPTFWQVMQHPNENNNALQIVPRVHIVGQDQRLNPYNWKDADFPLKKEFILSKDCDDEEVVW